MERGGSRKLCVRSWNHSRLMGSSLPSVKFCRELPQAPVHSKQLGHGYESQECWCFNESRRGCRYLGSRDSPSPPSGLAAAHPGSPPPSSTGGTRRKESCMPETRACASRHHVSAQCQCTTLPRAQKKVKNSCLRKQDSNAQRIPVKEKGGGGGVSSAGPPETGHWYSFPSDTT